MSKSGLCQWFRRKLKIKYPRLIPVIFAYIFFLMTTQRKHSLTAAAVSSTSSKSRFSKFLKNHHNLSVTTLESLSKRQAQQFGKNLSDLVKNGNWKIAILIDATFQKRSSLHPENVQKFNHGKGYVIGHQWTNVVLYFNGMLIPLAPIGYHTKKYCRENRLKYKTENERVVEYIENLNLTDYFGTHDSKSVIVLADSGYDDQKIENAINRKKWSFIIALKKCRTVKTVKAFNETPKKKGWSPISEFFKNHRRWAPWKTISVPKKKKRMEFRVRQIEGYLRHVGTVLLICSEFKNRSKGPRKFLACNDLKATPKDIIMGYRIRWEIEIFHKKIKMFLGFEHVATKSFKSVISHVHWVYCAFILITSNIPGLGCQTDSIAEKQQVISNLIRKKELAKMHQILTQFNGAKRLKKILKAVLNGTETAQNLF